ncbi:MAG: hypothetical protein ACK2UN_00430, partial [Candidatus Promineifilaceae bacterium]
KLANTIITIVVYIVLFALAVLLLIWIKNTLVSWMRYLRKPMTPPNGPGITEEQIDVYNKLHKVSASAPVARFFRQTGGIMLFVANAVILYQAYLWLKTGVWNAIPLYALLDWLSVDYAGLRAIEWLGIRKILLWIVEMPLAVALV